MISIGIIEDDEEIREAIRDFLNRQPGMTCERAAGSVEAFLKQVTDDNVPEILLTDIGLPGMSGISGIRIIKQRYPDIDIVMLTIHDDPDKIFESLCAGATGYLLKNTPFAQIVEGIETLRKGGAPMSPEIARQVITRFRLQDPRAKESPLTEREREIVVGIVDGLSHKMIAGRMGISTHTVRVHVKNIYKKLQVHTKAEIVGKSFRGEI
jgi:DNA-binding NarL/FixJ family response regulator